VAWRAAEPCLLRALELAREAEAKALELRAATSLARVWYAYGRGADARAALAPVCAWFGAEATSLDLREARRVLEEVSPAAAPVSARRATRPQRR
jgi:predicted ATPase